MIELRSNIWSYHSKESVIVIPTNGTVKKTGECVMGKGLALQAKTKYPSLPKLVGQHIKLNGNTVGYFPEPSLASFPVKWNWYQKADKLLIYRSLKELVYLVQLLDLNLEGKELLLKPGFQVYLTRVGCGNGLLDWKDIKPLVEEILTESRYIVVDRLGGKVVNDQSKL